MTTPLSYNHTLYASYLGYVTQAIVNNFAPLLFLTFQSELGIPLSQITLLVTINFGIQLVVDLLSAKFVDRIGYRTCAVAAHFCCAVGLAGMAFLPQIMDPYGGLLASIALYAVGGGLIEVLISPIVEACPTEKKAAAMSLLHSFYCWGHLFVVLVSTGFFVAFGIGNWRVLAWVWALLPLANAFYFMKVPIATLTQEGGGMPLKKLLSMKLFWVFMLLMVCAGASEQGMSQWASAFAEAGLQVNKTVGDLAGPCMFAAMMGLSRLFYAKFSDKVSLKGFMAGSTCLCLASYLLAAFAPHPLLGLMGCGLCGLSVGIMWPGTFSLAAQRCPAGGTPMFALFALAGDLGCSSGPTLVGLVADAAGGLKAGLTAALIFPALLLLGLWLLRRVSRQGGEPDKDLAPSSRN